MATYNADNPAIKVYGRLSPDNTFGYSPIANGTEIAFVVDATTCDLLLYGNNTTNAFELSIDSAAYADITLSSSGVAVTYTAFSGLTAGEHLVKLRSKFGGTTGFLKIASFVTTTGGSGAIRAPSTTEGYGPYALLNAGAVFVDLGNMSTAGSAYSSPTNIFDGQFRDARFRVRCAGGAGEILKLWAFANGAKVTVDIDGTRSTTVTLPTGNFWTPVEMVTLDGTEHTYGFSSAKQGVGAGSGHFYADGVMLVGASAAFSASAPPSLALGRAIFGDSISRGETIPEDTSRAILWPLCIPSGRNAYNRGIDGNRIADLKARTADVTGLNASIDSVLIICGTNDRTAGTTIGDAVTSGTYTGDWKLTLNQLLTGLTDSQTIRILKILPRTGYTPNQLKTYDDALDVAVAACSAPSRVKVLTVGGSHPWIMQYNGDSSAFTDPVGDTSDGLHPDDSGNPKIVNRLLPSFATTGISLSGPSSGVNGQSSTSFTITIAAGATFTGDQTVTLTASNGSITATATSGSISGNGTGTVIVTPANGAGNFTFTYTPSSAGSKTITYTNGQGWADPSASSYTATAADSSSSSSSSSSDSSESSSSDSSESSSSDSSRSSNSSSSSSSSSSEDDHLIYLHPNPAYNGFPTILVNGGDMGRLSKIDEMTYQFATVKNFRGPVTVTMHSPYGNTDVYFTLGSQNPSNNSRKYSHPITFRQNSSGSSHTVIKARAYDRTNANKKSQIIRLEFRIVG